jgi:hypothetical protein
LNFSGILTGDKTGLNIVSAFAEQRATAHGSHYTHLKAVPILQRKYIKFRDKKNKMQITNKKKTLGDIQLTKCSTYTIFCQNDQIFSKNFRTYFFLILYS